MDKISTLLYGEEYTHKMSQFNKEVEQMHTSYDGDYDTENPYFTILPLRKNPDSTENPMKLTFDQNKEIPEELKRNVNDIFHRIFGYKDII
jgi:hypothetical protein